MGRKFDKNRRGVRTLDLLRDKYEGAYRGGEGMAPAATACQGYRKQKWDHE